MRKTQTYTVTEAGRDQGKLFKLTELDAWDAEQWAMRAFFALMNAGIDVPENVSSLGLAGMAGLGLSALGKVPYEAAKPLLDEMLRCIEIIPDPSKPNVVRALIKSDIEEVQTMLVLRKAVFDLHIDFLRLGAPSTSGRAPASTD